MKATREEFERRFENKSEGNTQWGIFHVLVEIAWQLMRIADKKDKEIDPYSMEGTGVEVEEAKG